MAGTDFLRARILIVDDQQANVRLLERLLRGEGYEHVLCTTDPLQTNELCDSFAPDLILLDLQMPHMDGFAVMERLKPKTSNGAYLPILILTADISSSAKRRSLTLGARDFITKPFDPTEVLLRIKNLLETRFLHLQLRAQNDVLEERVRERTSELWTVVQRIEQAEQDVRASHAETIERLCLAAEFRDDETGRHITRMSHYCELIARAAGVEESRCEDLRFASQMHDVGKIGTPDHILLKPGSLTPEERKIMQHHTEMGHRILANSKSELLQLAATIALTHHERVDGGGYPHGLQGDDIPLEGRIAAIADVFDALTNDRVYRKAFPFAQAIVMMKDLRGSQFDPTLLDCFFDAMPLVLGVKERFEDGDGYRVVTNRVVPT